MSRQSDSFHLIKIANPVPDPDRMPERPDSASAQALLEEIIGMWTARHLRRVDGHRQ